ncbi:MAG: hypothetical protein P8180_10580 [Gammaproteobacteria bacterium]|jgi:hypothetical protein
MSQFPSKETIEALDKALDSEAPLPNENPAREHIVNWHVFRRRESALQFARNIMIESGVTLVGGNTSDSVGRLWWVGIRVDNLEKWGHKSAIQMHDRVDPQNPHSPML